MLCSLVLMKWSVSLVVMVIGRRHLNLHVSNITKCFCYKMNNVMYIGEVNCGSIYDRDM